MQVLDKRQLFSDELLEGTLLLELVATAGCCSAHFGSFRGQFNGPYIFRHWGVDFGPPVPWPGALLWLGLELFMSSSPEKELERTEPDSKLHIPTAFDIMWEGLLDASCFIFGCVLWLLACSQFLHKYGSESREVDTIILCFPVIFGPAALLRIFFSMMRRQLYYALFRRGILLKLNQTSLFHDFLLMWSGAGIVLAVSAVLRGLFLAVKTGQISSMDVVVTQLLVFISPLYTMVSALLYSLDTESACIRRKCTLELEDLGENLTVSTDHKAGRWEKDSCCGLKFQGAIIHSQVAILTEPQFCSAASSVISATDLATLNASGALDAGGDDLRLSMWDMRWASRLISQTCLEHRLSLVLLMPVLAVCILTLNLTSTVLCIKHRSDMPQLSSLESTIGELVPPLSPELREHTLYVDIMRRALSIEAGMDPTQTSSLDVSIAGDSEPPPESRFDLGDVRLDGMNPHENHTRGSQSQEQRMREV